jgi:hypothetical protein
MENSFWTFPFTWFLNGTIRIKDNMILSIAFNFLFLMIILFIISAILFVVYKTVRYFSLNSKPLTIAARILLFVYGFFYFLTAFVLGVFLVGVLVLPSWGDVAYGLAVVSALWYGVIISFFRKVKKRGEKEEEYEDMTEATEKTVELNDVVISPEEKAAGGGEEQVVTVDKKQIIIGHFRTIIQKIKSHLNTYVDGLKNHYMLFLFAVIIMVGLSVGLNLGLCGMCISYFPVSVSTQFTRNLLGIGKICQEEEICFSYLSVPEDITTSMIFNFHFTTSKKFQAKVKLNTIHEALSPDCKRITVIADLERYHCQIYFKNLQPGNTYHTFATVLYEKEVEGEHNSNSTHEEFESEEIKFRTGDNIHSNFIQGGDMSFTEAGISLLKEAAHLEPLFAVLGGDISYDNGDQFCYLVWDNFFTKWEHMMVTPSNYSIPILVSVGNHEAGGFYRPKSDVPFLLDYFPYNSNSGERTFYRSHKTSSNSVIIVLNSEVTLLAKDQNQFLEETLIKYESFKYKFAVYHHPIFPGHKTIEQIKNNDPSISKNMFDNWTPLFDKYHLTAAFENHFHYYKKSFPIKDGKVDPSGTIYLGDGAFGVEPKDYGVTTDDNKLMQSIQAINNFWYVSTDSNNIEYKSTGYTNEKGVFVLDTWKS